MAKRQTKNKRKRSVLAPSPPQMVILRVCMVLLALLLAAITLLNRGSDTVMNTAYPRKYDEYVTYYAGKYQIDPYILYSIIRTESNFNPQAESNVGARGLMQITGHTFYSVQNRIFYNRLHGKCRDFMIEQFRWNYIIILKRTSKPHLHDIYI